MSIPAWAVRVATTFALAVPGAASADSAIVSGGAPDAVFADSFEGDCANGTETPVALERRWRDAIAFNADSQCITGSTFGDIVNGGEYCLEDQGHCVAGCEVSFVPTSVARQWGTTFDLDLAWQGSAVMPIAYRLLGMPSSCTLTVQLTGGIIGHRFTYTAQAPDTALDLAFLQSDDQAATPQLTGCQALVAAAGPQLQQIIAEALTTMSQSSAQAGAAALAGRDACPAPLP